MNNLFIIIIIIIIIISISKLSMLYEKKKIGKKIIEYLENTEEERNKAMKGLSNMKYYINFSFHYNLFNLFDLVTKKLDEKNINYFLICGGLIGYFRHNQGLIPWDDDIDIGVMEEDRSKFQEAIKEITKNNNKIELGIHDIDKVLYGKFNNNAIQVDVFYYKFFPDKNYYAYNVDKHRNMWPNEYLYKDDIYPLQKVDYKLYAPDGTIYKTIKINIPNKSKDYLSRAYKNWETVKKPGHVHSDYYDMLF
jgi:phosphorylcholine metabolism protein LicD